MKAIFKSLLAFAVVCSFSANAVNLDTLSDFGRDRSFSAIKTKVLDLVRKKRILTAAKKIALELRKSKMLTRTQKSKLEELMWTLTDSAVNILVKSNDLDQAADFVQKLMVEYPLWSHGKDAFRRVAFLHGMNGKWYRAQKMARRYIKTTTVDAYTPDMLYLLAVSLEQMGHVRQASLTLRRFVQLFPQHENLASAKSKLASLDDQAGLESTKKL